jgi:pimeloyl-ACP methyl ester carboxylesterase
VLFMHFTGTMDHWDPAVTDGLARDREVILFDNAGISSSSGEVPNTIEGMAADAAVFIGALGLRQVDLLGFSIGGTVTQALTLRRVSEALASAPGEPGPGGEREGRTGTDSGAVPVGCAARESLRVPECNQTAHTGRQRGP